MEYHRQSMVDLRANRQRVKATRILDSWKMGALLYPVSERSSYAYLTTCTPASVLHLDFLAVSDIAALLLTHVEASSVLYFIYDMAVGRVTYVSPAYEILLHGDRNHVNEELPGLLTRLHPDDQAYLAQCWKLWERGQLRDEVDLRLQSPGQPDQWLSMTASTHHTATGQSLLLGTLRDISAAKHYQHHADDFSMRKNTVLEILSHDLSGNFVLVQQVAAYLRDVIKAPTDSRITEMLGVLESTSRASVGMIRDLINIEFLASANSDLKRERREVGITLGPILQELQRQQELLGQHFAYSLPTEPAYVFLDVDKMHQVLTNLIGNAIKFTPDGGHVAIDIEVGSNAVYIRVIDDGIGIPEALLPQLFERFTPARRVGLRGEPTTGLGLILCKTIVEWHQGTLTVASVEGQGSTFAIELPRVVG